MNYPTSVAIISVAEPCLSLWKYVTEVGKSD